MCVTVAYRLKRSACNVGSTDSSLVRDSFCVGTLIKFSHTISQHLRRRVQVEALLIGVREALYKCIVTIQLCHSSSPELSHCLIKTFLSLVHKLCLVSGITFLAPYNIIYAIV